MAIERFLPKFHVVEINNSTAHRIGHAIAQVPAYVGQAKDSDGQATTDYALISSVEKNGIKFVENGIIVGLDSTGVLANYDSSKHSKPCLVYNDELITGPLTSLNRFAEEAEDGEPVYVRALPLYLGDTFTTDNFSGEAADGYAKVVDGVLTLTASSTDALFIATKTTMPNGEVGMEFMYIGA